MKTLLLFSLLLSLLYSFQTSPPANNGSSLEVTSFKWTRSRQKIEAPPVEGSGPARAMIPQNRIFDRNARSNNPNNTRDPNAETVDGRSSAMDKAVAESRSPKTKTMDGFAYRIKVQNSGKRAVETVFWEYQFLDPADPNVITRRQFVCAVDIGPGKGKEMEGFSLAGPSDVVNVQTLADNAANPIKESVVINRVEFSDGIIWQRKAWDFAALKNSYDRVLREQWQLGMCKGL